MLAILAQINESQWWSQKAIEAQQYQQLSQLLKHAVTTTPYYNSIIPDHLHQRKLTPENWLSIPLLDRTTARAQFDALQSNAVPAVHGPMKTSATSGSTGKPVRVKHTALSNAFEGAAILRYHHWHNRNFNASLASIKRYRLPDSEELDYFQENWGWPVSDVYPSGPVGAITLHHTVSEQATWLRRMDPEYLLSLPSNLLALIQHFEANNLSLPNLKNVSTMMEVVSPELRKQCWDVWGVPIVDSYSCRETGTLAAQCPNHEHYHVVSENNFVEILRDDGTPCEPGETGRVVVTDLHNFAMPFIRYELGDYAELGDHCSCGRGLPVITRIHGRLRNMILLPDGDRIWPHMARSSLAKIEYLKQYQFVQTEKDTIQANFVVSRPVSPEEEQEVVSILSARWRYPFKVVFNYPESIATGAEGKIEDFRCEVDS